MDKHTEELLNHQRTAYEKQLAEIRQSLEECSNDAGARKRKLDDQAQEMATLEKEIATLKNELLKQLCIDKTVRCMSKDAYDKSLDGLDLCEDDFENPLDFLEELKSTNTHTKLHKLFFCHKNEF